MLTLKSTFSSVLLELNLTLGSASWSQIYSIFVLYFMLLIRSVGVIVSLICILLQVSVIKNSGGDDDDWQYCGWDTSVTKA